MTFFVHFCSIFFDYTMKKVNRVSGDIRWTGGTTLKGLAHADDICLMGDDVDSVVALTDSLIGEG